MSVGAGRFCPPPHRVNRFMIKETSVSFSKYLHNKNVDPNEFYVYPISFGLSDSIALSEGLISPSERVGLKNPAIWPQIVWFSIFRKSQATLMLLYILVFKGNKQISFFPHY